MSEGPRPEGRAPRLAQSAFEVGDDSQVDLQIGSFDWKLEPHPPRVFLDHGSFADASF